MLLCGEKNSIKPKNFYLGNSPLEYLHLNKNIISNERNYLKDKEILFTSTNGAKIISHDINILTSKYYKIQQFVLSFLNIQENVNFLFESRINNLDISEMNKDESNTKTKNQNISNLIDLEIVLVCGGENGKLSIEDTVCALMFKYQILKKINNLELNFIISDKINEKEHKDIENIKKAFIAEKFSENNENKNNIELINELILNHYKDYIYKNSSHIERLKELNFEKDIEFCLAMNQYSSILILENDLISKLNN